MAVPGVSSTPGPSQTAYVVREDNSRQDNLTPQEAFKLADDPNVRFAVMPARDAFDLIDPGGQDILGYHRENRPYPIDLQSHGSVHLFGNGTYFSLDPNETQYGNVVTQMRTPRSALDGKTAIVWLDEGMDAKYSDPRPSIADAPGADMVVVGVGMKSGQPIRNFVLPPEAKPVLDASTVKPQLQGADLDQAKSAFQQDMQALEKNNPLQG